MAGAAHQHVRAADAAIVTINPIVLPDAARTIDLEVRITAPMSGGPFPIVLYSHGAQYSKDDYLPLAEYWAANGYIVIQPTHIESRALNLPTGDPRLATAWKTRILDMRHVLDALDEIERKAPLLKGKMDRAHVVAAGHSFGGHTVGGLIGAIVTDPETGKEVDLSDKRIAAGIQMAPPGFGPGLRTVSWKQMNKPTLVIVGDKDENANLKQAWQVHADSYYGAPSGEKCLGVLAGMQHYLGGILGTNRTEEATPSADSLAQIKRVTLAFLNTWAKNSKEWPTMRAELLAARPAAFSAFECK